MPSIMTQKSQRDEGHYTHEVPSIMTQKSQRDEGHYTHEVPSIMTQTVVTPGQVDRSVQLHLTESNEGTAREAGRSSRCLIYRVHQNKTKLQTSEAFEVWRGEATKRYEVSGMTIR